MQLAGLVIAVVIGAVCTRRSVTETDSHAVDPGPSGDGLVRRRRDAQGDSVAVFERL